jgi:hypothetical protein
MKLSQLFVRSVCFAVPQIAPQIAHRLAGTDPGLSRLVHQRMPTNMNGTPARLIPEKRSLHRSAGVRSLKRQQKQLAMTSQSAYKAEDVLAIIASMSLPERKRLFDAMDSSSSPSLEVGYAVFPKGILDVVIASAHGAIDQQRGLIKAIVQADRLLSRRNRKSAPATVRRNIEICDLRRKDQRTWSFRRLSNKYGITYQSIQRIIRDESKWRKLGSRLDT